MRSMPSCSSMTILWRRDRVRQRLPEVEVWGEDMFGLRRRLLSDPRLQLPVVTAEAAARSRLVMAHIERLLVRAETADEARYIESLQIQCRMECLEPYSERLERVEELFQRTTQFNTTGRKFSAAELGALAGHPDARLFAIDVSDRFGHHGTDRNGRAGRRRDPGLLGNPGPGGELPRASEWASSTPSCATSSIRQRACRLRCADASYRLRRRPACSISAR